MIFDKLFGGKKERKQINDVEKIKLAIDKKKNVSSSDKINQNEFVSNIVKNQNNFPLAAQQSLSNQNITLNNNLINPNVQNQTNTLTTNSITTAATSQVQQSIVNQPQVTSQTSANSVITANIQQQENSLNRLNNNISNMTNNNFDRNTHIDLNNLNKELNSLIINETSKKEVSNKTQSELVFGKEHLENKKEEEEEEELFIRLDKYEEIVKTIKLIKEKINENELILERIVNIKKEEDAKLNKWENELRSIYEKIKLVEENLKNVK